MKDAAHHLRHIQRKVIQEIRKSSGETKVSAKETVNNNNKVASIPNNFQNNEFQRR